MTSKLKQRFCKDNGVKIQVYTEPYFSQRIELLGYEKEYNNFVEMMQKYFDNDEKKFLDYSDNVSDAAINYIKNSSAYINFNNCDINNIRCKNIAVTKDIYNKNNVNKDFISIDISKANFSALVHYSSANGFDFNSNSYDYRKFMQNFTDNEYFINSKYIRQVIFGKCNCSRLITYQKYLINDLIDKLLYTKVIDTEDIVSINNDEIVIDVTNKDFKCIEKIKRAVFDNEIVPLSLEYFTLRQVIGIDAYVKQVYFNSNCNCRRLKLQDCRWFGCSYTIKKADPMNIVFIQRLLNGEEILEDDLVFYYNNTLAKLMEKPKIEVELE